MKVSSGAIKLRRLAGLAIHRGPAVYVSSYITDQLLHGNPAIGVLVEATVGPAVQSLQQVMHEKSVSEVFRGERDLARRGMERTPFAP